MTSGNKIKAHKAVALSTVVNILATVPPHGNSGFDACDLTSVFLLLFGEDEPRILAIQKADNEGYPWRNQIALPGGHVDQADSSPLDAAYRELREELGIFREHVHFINSLGHFQTINNKDLEVFVGRWNEKGPIRYDSNEIARILTIPLSSLFQTHLDKGFHDRLPDVPELVYPVQNTVIWGVTGKIVHYLLEKIYPLFTKKAIVNPAPGP